MDNKFELSGKASIRLPNHKLEDAERFFDQSPECIKSRLVWKDGFILEFIQTAEEIKVTTNKTITLNSDNSLTIE